MFRKPRETSQNTTEPPLPPSTGRPPTPPNAPLKTPFTLAIPPDVPVPSRMAASKTRQSGNSKSVPLPTIGRQGPTGSAKKSPAGNAKTKGTGNGNIMSFFKKAEEEAGLFVRSKYDSIPANEIENVEPAPNDDLELYDEGDESMRFNESGGSVKRMRMSSGPVTPSQPSSREIVDDRNPAEDASSKSLRKTGPFFEESDSEEGEEDPEAIIPVGDTTDDVAQADETTGVAFSQATNGVDNTAAESQVVGEDDGNPNDRPPLIKEETSYDPGLEDFQDFEGMDDFDEDPFEEGDEYMERRYMEEQARLEAEEGEADRESTNGVNANIEPTESFDGPSGDAPTCPICSISLGGVNEQDAGVHVNNCLDGNPTPLPSGKGKVAAPVAIKKEDENNTPDTAVSANQYRKPQRAPKPGQANPFVLGQSNISGGSAFNKLMSGHAEDAAWAQAAASEHASRGKPSYQRTCPFYKILPGLFICVDAFRYGAVEGCKAYFLSHFHSDHYVGLTSNWSHGPIFCSKVTGNLVRQQLRVDPKYVVDLEWEKPVEVPGTKGVKATMISANHCPGSSLFLFEKTVGKKMNGEPKLQRILHCGDFRACRQHIEHPLLMPNVQDKLKGTSKEQKIDVCYLDTTYLNPKYAFPSQQTVIKACADMCVSLSKHSVDESDGWEQMKRQRAGEGMAKFVRKESNPEIKEEPVDEDDTDGVKLTKNPHASQQVLTSSTTPNVQDGRGRLLVVVGTYSIGKERICLGIAKALNSKIYAPPSKQRIVAALEDPELDARMTNDPRVAQVHMTPLFEIRAETLDDYLKDYFPHFTRAVGFRPSGWNYRPPNSRFTESPSVQTVLYSDNWKSNFSMKDLVPQRGSTSRASCFGVPYSEHSSFRELTMFCCALRIEKVIPTVNVGSAKSRERMKAWVERWMTERRKNGLYKLPEDGSW